MNKYKVEIDYAKLASTFSTHKKPVGACIHKKKMYILGWNKQKTHPFFSNGKPWFSIHAEMDAVLKAKTDLRGATIYVYRESNGKPALSKPCAHCMKHLIEVGIKTVYYTVPYEPFFERIDL